MLLYLYFKRGDYMVKAEYKDISEDLSNIVGLFYELKKNLATSSHNHEIQTYILSYKNNDINLKKYAIYSMITESDFDKIKRELELEGYINLKKLCQINKERLIGDQDVLTLVKKNQIGL